MPKAQLLATTFIIWFLNFNLHSLSSEHPLFRYAVYKTRVGLALHQRTCAECTRPHSESVSIPILPDVHITIVPILHDNYGFRGRAFDQLFPAIFVII
jgi:hypothetical protein